MAPSDLQERVIIMAPAGRDAAAVGTMLQEQGFQADISGDPTESCQKISSGAGALLFTEEALELAGFAELLNALKTQPPWSELPILILTKGGESRQGRLLDLIADAGRSITLLERPMSAATLVRSIQVALRSRRRQYHVRDLIEQQRRDQELLREGAQALGRVKEELAQANAALERRVLERTAELRATNEQLETFVYSAAHDLRAPLRSISAYSQLLVEDHASILADDAVRLLDRIQNSAEFMDRLLLDLLAFGRAARGEMELGPVDVQAAWEAACFQCATEVERTKARIETVKPLPKVRSHEATLAQCLANLLSNSLKFVAPHVQPHVRFWAEAGGKGFRLWLEDNGIGIPESEHERIFRVFERLHGARYPGTGIGLSIVRKGIERMGGRLGLESALGEGSGFWIELPNMN
jgi:signal transduction histidine kinase